MARTIVAALALLVTFLVLQPRIASTTKRKMVTVLSIDRGGIRCIIFGTILAFLESKLQISNLFGGSKYDGKYLRSLVRLELANLIMKQTLTHTLIPTFDIERLQPIIFTTTDVRKMTKDSQVHDARTTMATTSIATTIRANTPQAMEPAEKPKTFVGIDFIGGSRKCFSTSQLFMFKGSHLRKLQSCPREPPNKIDLWL
ncbi:hypothetical protein CQW23_03631 [Capsicum baccatum]|uniref:Uncharacterized protein n=1 Tax=Capsicum baccatum TaxID=33114 RepID=A0A2G2XCD5_CAPBA|nr:hypothetical protein CQW23_03631 [Capsicum baccatum]